MSSLDIIKNGNEMWQRSKIIEIKAILLFATISLIALIPAMIISYLAYNNDISSILIIGGVITVFLMMVHISFVLGIIYVIDENIDNNSEIDISETIRKVFSKLKPLSVVSIIFSFIILTPLSFIDVFLFDNYMNDILLQIMLISVNYVLLIILGVPWFFSVANVVIKDQKGIESVKKALNKFNQQFSSILPISFIAISPVIIYTGIVSLITYFIARAYDFELPEGFALIGWGISFMLAFAIFMILILPWSLDVTFPMYKMDNTRRQTRN